MSNIDEPLDKPARLLKSFEDNNQIKGNLKLLAIGEDFCCEIIKFSNLSKVAKIQFS